MTTEENKSPDKPNFWHMILGSALVSALVTLTGSYFLQSDARQKGSLEKEIVYAERASANLTNDFAEMTLLITQTKVIPEKEKLNALRKISDLYQAISRVEHRINNSSLEIIAYKKAVNDLRAALVKAESFMEYKHVLEVMGSVKLSENEAFNWLTIHADINRST